MFRIVLNKVNTVRLIIADPQYLTRAGFVQLFSATPVIKVVGEADTMQDLQVLVKKHRPDLVVMDYHRSDAFPLEEIGRIRKEFPGTHFLIVTDDDQKKNIFKTLELGASSILTKNCSKDEILSAVHATAKGEKFFCNKVLDILLEKHLQADSEDDDCSSASLSVREIEIVELIAQGIATKEIADRLCLSPHTVYTHRKNMMKKLGVNSATELVMWAVNAGIVKTGVKVS